MQNRNRLTDLDNEFMVIGEKDGGRIVWEFGYVHTAIFKMDNQQGPTVEHRELCSKLCGRLDGREVWERMDTCICMAESLYCPSETVTILLISYTPIKMGLVLG